MALRRVTVRGNRGPRRKTSWFDFASLQTDFTGLAANSALLFSSLNAAALALRPFTIVRTRGLLTVTTDQIAATERPFGAFGISVVTDQATAIGITAVPQPGDDAGSDEFLLWEPWSANVQLGSNIGFADLGRTFVLDSKAMRKVDIGQDVVAVMDNQSNTDAVDFALTYRMLVKLH